MKNLTLAMKSLYYLYIIAMVSALLCIAFAFYTTFSLGAVEATIALSFFGGFCTIYFFLFARRLIWLKLIDESSFTYGNLFHSAVASVDEIESFSSLWYGFNTYKIRIKNKKYYFVTYWSREAIENVLYQT